MSPNAPKAKRHIPPRELQERLRAMSIRPLRTAVDDALMLRLQNVRAQRRR